MANIFENAYAYVNEKGELWQKDNKYFQGKILHTFELEAQKSFDETLLTPFEDAFEAFKERVKNLESESDITADALAEKISALIDEAFTVQALGDFESILDELHGDDNEDLSVASKESGEEQDQARDSLEASDSDSGSEEKESEENKPEQVDPEQELAEQTSGVVEEDNTGDEKEDGEISESLGFYHALVQKARECREMSDLSMASHQLDDIRFKWSDGPDVEEEDSEQFRAFQSEIEEIKEEIKSKRSEHYDEMTRRRNENLERKKEFIQKLKNIVEKKRWSAIGEVKRLQHRFEDIKNIPSEWHDSIEQQFATLLAAFDEGRVDYVVAQKEKEENNLIGKLAILDKMKQIVDGISKDAKWDDLDRDFDGLLNQWKKIGRVAREKEQESWDSYHEVVNLYESKKYELNAEFKALMDKNIEERTKLCDAAEALMDTEDLAEGAREINHLHKEWKKYGPVPREHSEPLWQRFKAASDAFNKRKNDNLDVVREQENENLDEAMALIEKAKTFIDPDDYISASKEIDKISRAWKNLGPVPRKKSRQIWKDFKSVMDDFYKGKREFFKSQRQDQKSNLKAKRDVIDEIRKLAEHENAQEAVELVKPLQKKFNDIGWVPIKAKNKIWKQYQEACDLVYERSRKEGGGSPGRGRSKAASHSSNDEIYQLKKEQEKLKEVVLHYSDTMTFIKPNKEGLKLRDDLQSKIDAAEKQIEEKQNKIDDLRRKESEKEDSETEENS